MKNPAFLALLCLATVLIVWALNTRAKEGALIFLVGAALLLSTLVIAGLRVVGKGSPRTNRPGERPERF